MQNRMPKTAPSSCFKTSLVNPKELHDVYLAIIRSIFDYCCPLFMKLPIKLVKKIRKVEKRAHRLIFGDQRTCACELDGFVQRRNLIGIKLLSKIRCKEQHSLHSRVPARLPHNDRLRNIPCRTNIRQNSFFAYSTLLHNQSLTTNKQSSTHSYIST